MATSKPPRRSASQPKTLTDESKAQLWRLGVLLWKLHADQLRVYWQIVESKASRFVLEIARRWGKTWLLCLLAIECCLRKPGARVVYGAPTLKHLEEFVMPAFEALIADAPSDCKPEFNQQSGHWTFPNGSHVHLFGADDKRKADRGRGPSADLVLFDEAGFTPILRYVLRAVLRPQTLHTGGITVLASTPAEEPDHDFTKIAEIAEAKGTYARRTIHDNPRLSPERVQQYIAEDAADEGMSVEEYVRTDTFRREYMAERITDKLLVVMGDDWQLSESKCVREVQRPEFFDGYGSFDIGGADPHAHLFGHLDFKNGWLVIEHELLLRDGQNTALVAEAVKAKEKEAWGSDSFDGRLRGTLEHLLAANVPDWVADKLGALDGPKQPYLRVADNDLHVLRDMLDLHGLLYCPTGKDEKQLQVNNLRILVRQNKLVVHPRCVNLVRHFRGTVWKNEKRADYKRKGGEHGDLLDAAVYMGRNVNWTRNPWPLDWRETTGVHVSKKFQPEPQARKIAEAFVPKTPWNQRLRRAR